MLQTAMVREMLRCSGFIALLVIIGLHECSSASYELQADGKTCLIVNTSATLHVAYFNTAGQQVVATWPLGAASAIGGACDSVSAGQASLNLTFDGYWLEFQFASVANQSSLTGLALGLDVQNGSRFINPNDTSSRVLTGKPNLTLSPDTEHFACRSAIRLDLAAQAAPTAGSFLSLANTQLQAFHVNGSLSDKGVTCAEDATTTAEPATTTVSNTTATTEAATTTATTMAPGTTVMPTTAAPMPPLLNLTFFDPASRTPCLRLQLRAAFAIVYGQKSGANATATVAMPTSTAVRGGSCGNSSQTIQLAFRDTWLAELTFTRQNAGSYALRLISLAYSLTADLFPDAAGLGQNRSALGNRTYFTVGSGGAYYTCDSAKSLALDTAVAMETHNFRAQAFRTDNGTAQFFGSPVQCQDDTPIDNVVPIVVGAALAGLVIVVLIAYLIGRRRHSSGGGYQSV